MRSDGVASGLSGSKRIGMKLADILASGDLRATSDTPVRYAAIDVMKAVLGDDVCPPTLCAMYGRLRKEHDLPQDFVFFRVLESNSVASTPPQSIGFPPTSNVSAFQVSPGAVGCIERNNTAN